MSNPRFNYIKVKVPRKNKNFASVCEELAKNNKTYAEWQKERYSTLYDVKTLIKENKKKGVY